MGSTGKAMGVTPKNINQQIAQCENEITKLTGGSDGTIISTVINFVKGSGKAVSGLASSEEKDQKIKELNDKLKDLLEKKKNQGQGGESSDSPDGLTDDELSGDGDLKDYVDHLKETGTPYDVVRKGNMIGIKINPPGKNPNSMSGILKDLMERVGGKMPNSEATGIKNSELDDKTKSELNDVVSGLKRSGEIDFSDTQSAKKSAQNLEPENRGQGNNQWYDDKKVLDTTREGLINNNSESELLAATPINENKEAIDLMHLQVSYAKETAARGRTVLMPVQIGGNHWVGGAMTQEGEKFKFIHNDPLGNNIDSNLKKVLESQGVDVIDLQHKQQTDAHNCGPFTADNLVKFSNAIEASKESGSDIASKEFKENLSAELSKDGDKLRESQSYTPPNTPPRGNQNSDTIRTC